MDESQELAQAMDALELNKKSNIYRLPPELIARILAYVAIESGRDFRRALRSARIFKINETDSLFWQPLCEYYYTNCSIAKLKYPTWYDMFMQRPQVRFDGVYVAESKYFRLSEQQNGSWYQPLMEVTYYRYIRLWNDGRAQTLLTVREPDNVLPFGADYSKDGKCVGEWRIDEDHNILALNTDMHQAVKDHTGRLAFKILSENGRVHNVLKWRGHKIKRHDEQDWFDVPLRREANFYFQQCKDHEDIATIQQ